jgi:hypothetical protein
MFRQAKEEDMIGDGTVTITIPMAEYQLLAAMHGLAAEMATELEAHTGDMEDLGTLGPLLNRYHTVAVALGRHLMRRADERR